MKVTVILTKYKREDWFNQQLNAIQNQTYPIEEILICDNTKEAENYGPWRRFALALMANTEWVWILDDDQCPLPQHLEWAMKQQAIEPAVRGVSGTYLPKGVVSPKVNIEGIANWINIGGCAIHSDLEIKEPTEVDFVIQSYLFKRDWLTIFWGERRFHEVKERFYGEDQWLSAQCRKIGIKAYIIGEDPNDPDAQSKGQTGVFDAIGQKDGNGLWASGSHEFKRNYAKHWRDLIINHNFKPIKYG